MELNTRWYEECVYIEQEIYFILLRKMIRNNEITSNLNCFYKLM